ncbi:MAG: GYD domain-containing protein [Methanomicrobiales archaeon]|nr:GYD domain-containing protein [Methanomicrobiales archaeon]
MTLFVILGKLTQKAIDNIKSAGERDTKGEQVVKAAGGRLLANYYTFGRYDFVIVAELPSTEALAKVLIETSKWGTIRTETMTALTPEQLYKVAMTT